MERSNLMFNDDYNGDGRVDSQDINDEFEDEYMDDYNDYLHQLEEQEADHELNRIHQECDNESPDSLDVEDDLADDYVDLTVEEERNLDNEAYYRDQNGLVYVQEALRDYDGMSPEHQEIAINQYNYNRDHHLDYLNSADYVYDPEYPFKDTPNPFSDYYDMDPKTGEFTPKPKPMPKTASKEKQHGSINHMLAQLPIFNIAAGGINDRAKQRKFVRKPRSLESFEIPTKRTVELNQQDSNSKYDVVDQGGNVYWYVTRSSLWLRTFANPLFDIVLIGIVGVFLYYAAAVDDDSGLSLSLALIIVVIMIGYHYNTVKRYALEQGSYRATVKRGIFSYLLSTDRDL